MSYTSGPWVVTRGAAGDPFSIEGPTVTVAHAKLANGAAEANAHLIAAAPELLEACKRMLDLLNDDMDEEQCAAWDAMSAAIDKAEGMKP
jgi:hypothetical protein